MTIQKFKFLLKIIMVFSLYITSAGYCFQKVVLAEEVVSADILKQSDVLYETNRSDSIVAQKIKTILEQDIKQHGEKYDNLWRMTRILWWIAEGESKNEKMLEVAKKAWEFGDKAVASNPQGLEGNYWLSAAIGQYSLGIGVIHALAIGLEGKFSTPLDKAIKINPRFDCANPLRTKGIFYINLPWPRRDLEKAKSYMMQALNSEPRGLRSRWYLAQIYDKQGDKKAALIELEKILTANPASVDSGDLPRIQGWAKDFKVKLQK